MAFLLASSFTGFKLQTPFAVRDRVSSLDASSASPGIVACQQKEKDRNGSEKVRNNTASKKLLRRETILRSSGSALLLAFLNFAGDRPDYLGVQSNPPSLALCPPTPSCISTSEELNDPTHYVPPWTYNPQDGRGRKNPASKEKAMAELIDAIKTEKPDNFTPRIVKQTDDYIYVEYSSPLVGSFGSLLAAAHWWSIDLHLEEKELTSVSTANESRLYAKLWSAMAGNLLDFDVGCSPFKRNSQLTWEVLHES